MVSSQLILRVYYEQLHERMVAEREPLILAIDRVLRAEIARQSFSDMDADKLAAYRDACVAFLDERQECYNPIGIQYTFDRATCRRAAELEFQLNWYDSRAEFKRLAAAADALAGHDVPDEMLPDLARELIVRCGAFPDRSIVHAYSESPALQKLPDYVVACAIEEVVCRRKPTDGCDRPQEEG